MFLGQDSHLHLYEHGGAAQVGAAGWQALARAGCAPCARSHRQRRQEGGLLLPSAGSWGWGSLAGLRLQHSSDHPYRA